MTFYRRIAIKVLYMVVLMAGESAWAIDNIPKPVPDAARGHALYSIRDAKIVTSANKSDVGPLHRASLAGRPVLGRDTVIRPL